MTEGFKDHFSDKSKAYSEYRPTYPAKLFAYLASLTQGHDRAWDCGTGSGQSAIALSPFFTEVVGTDPSENQIKNAIQGDGVIYKTESAENTSFGNASVDLITVAQALHWFDLDRFTNEVMRVLKPQGVLAVWTYGLHKITPEIDAVIDDLYGPVVGEYWPPERRMVEEGYRNITFPMRELAAPQFLMQANWDLPQLVGYLNTWSAVKKYEAATGENPVDKKYDTLSQLWPDAGQKRVITWPLTLKLWVK